MQRFWSVLAGALVVGLFIGLSSRTAQASASDRLTYFTFSGPVEIPGVGLPAGTYAFKLADSATSRVVQVFSRDGRKLYATFFALPDTRLSPADHTIVTFYETPAGSPEAIKTWFYPGDTIGYELVYPKEQAMKIANAAPSAGKTSSNANSQ
jgi:hypothetical protein